MNGSLDVAPDAPLLVAPLALIEQWRRRVPKSHRELVAMAPPVVFGAQLGAWSALVLARKGAVTLLPADKGAVLALGASGASRDKLVAVLAGVKTWEEAGFELLSDGRPHVVFQNVERVLELALPEGRYLGTSAKAKVDGKPVVFVRLERIGDLRPRTLDVAAPPPLSDADFDAAEALTWVSVSDQKVVVIDAAKTWKGPAKAAKAPKLAGGALVSPSGSALLAWPIAGGVMLAGSEGGDAPDDVAAMLAIPKDRFVDTGLTLEVSSGAVRVFDPDGEEDEGLHLKLAKGTYRVAHVERFRTAAAELVSILLLAKT